MTRDALTTGDDLLERIDRLIDDELAGGVLEKRLERVRKQARLPSPRRSGRILTGAVTALAVVAALTFHALGQETTSPPAPEADRHETRQWQAVAGEAIDLSSGQLGIDVRWNDVMIDALPDDGLGITPALGNQVEPVAEDRALRDCPPAPAADWEPARTTPLTTGRSYCLRAESSSGHNVAVLTVLRVAGDQATVRVRRWAPPG